MVRRIPLLLRWSIIFALVALAALGLVAGPRVVNAQDSAGFAAGDGLVVNTDALNLRADASLSAEVLAVLDTGASVTVVNGPVSADGSTWYEVTGDAGDGWVAGEYLNATLTYSAAGDGYAVGDALFVDTELLNLRADASASADVVAQLVTGDSVTVVDGPVAADGYDWYQVDADAGDGWVDGEYLNTTVTATATAAATDDRFAIGDALVVDTDLLNVRADASTGAEVVTQLVAGDAVTVTDGPVSADGYTWYGVTSDAGDGWVAGDYLGTAATLFSAGEVAAGSTVVVETDLLNVRSDATTAGDVLAQLATGDTATVVDGPVSADGYGWYQIETTDGATGWVAGAYLALA